jgi:hypothetical protein
MAPLRTKAASIKSSPTHFLRVTPLPGLSVSRNRHMTALREGGTAGFDNEVSM